MVKRYAAVLFMSVWAISASSQDLAGQSAQEAKPGTNVMGPIAPGPFTPDWDSLKQYECPEWFRDAKFGIWAHWSAQCVPERGDWYAQKMYQEKDPDYKYHVEHSGAKYFVALANHHCNFDCRDSKYQPWNSVDVGPKKDIVGTWAEVARRNGLRFGVTVHCA